MFTTLIISIFSVSVLALAGAWFLYLNVKKKPIASKKIFDLALASKKNSRTELLKVGKNLGLAGIVVFTAFLYLFGWQVACGFLAGLILSVAISFFSAEVISASAGKILEVTRNDLLLAFSLTKKSALSICFSIFSLLALVATATLVFSFDIGVVFAFAFGAGILPVFSQAEKTQPKSFEFATGYFSTLAIALSVVIITMQNNFAEKIATIFPIILLVIALVSTAFGSLFFRIKREKNTFSAWSAIIIFLILLLSGYYFVGRFLGFSYFNLQTIVVGFLGFLGLIIFSKSFEVITTEATLIKNDIKTDDQFQNLELLISFGKKSRLFIKYFSALSTFVVCALSFIYFTSKTGGDFSLSNPVIIAGLVAGGILSYLFILSKKSGKILETAGAGILAILVALIFGVSVYAGVLAGMILLGLFLAVTREDGLLASPLAKSSLLIPLVVGSYILVDYSLKARLIIAGATVLILLFYFISIKYKQIWNWLLIIFKKYARKPKIFESKVS